MFSDAWTAQTQDPNHFFGLGIIVSKASKFIYVNAEDNCEERYTKTQITTTFRRHDLFGDIFSGKV